MALQTREQHIRREKATSNICTAQALLAIIASMYAVYHGPKGLRAIAGEIHGKAQILDKQLKALGYTQNNSSYFDTLNIEADRALKSKVKSLANKAKMNLYYTSNSIQVSIDECCSMSDLQKLVNVFAEAKGETATIKGGLPRGMKISSPLRRSSEYLTHPVFNSYHTETKMMRYIKQLENKDLSLTHSMIALGSCTMKLNAATQLIPVSWEEFANIHPFAPA